MAVKKVGRPKVKGLDRAISRTISIPTSIEKRYKKHFDSLGEAVIFAVNYKEMEQIEPPKKK